jgi:hypothetical protein
MYKVIKFFYDLQDNLHPYNVGDEYPRKGAETTDGRIAELASKNNLQGVPLIEKVETEEKPKKAKKAAKK